MSACASLTRKLLYVQQMDSRYEVESETKLKLKFLEELDKLEKQRHEEQEREKLLRAIKVEKENVVFISCEFSFVSCFVALRSRGKLLEILL